MLDKPHLLSFLYTLRLKLAYKHLTWFFILFKSLLSYLLQLPTNYPVIVSNNRESLSNKMDVGIFMNCNFEAEKHFIKNNDKGLYFDFLFVTLHFSNSIQF